MQPEETGSAKVRLRAELGARRRLRIPAERDAARAAIRDHILHRCTAESWRSVAAYVPTRTEPGSLDMLASLADRGVRVIVPIVLDDRDLDWTVFPDDHSLGVGAVAAVDAVLVPALAVARDGTRLGRGGGSYDRALARIGSGAPVAALLFEGELVAELPREDWDVAVNAVVTPSGWQPIGESGGRARS